MSIVSPPLTGHADWQNTIAWDGPAIVSSFALPTSPESVLGPFNVSAWNAIRFTASDEGGTASPYVQFVWWADEQQTYEIGRQKFYVSHGSVDWQGELIPNLGPWLGVYASGGGGTDTSIACVVVPTNRTDGGSTYNSEGSVARNSSNGLAVNGTLTLEPSPPFHGIGTLAIVSSEAGNFTWQPSTNFSVPPGATYPITAAVPYIQTWSLPRAHWSFVFTNTGGAAAVVDMVIGVPPSSGH